MSHSGQGLSLCHVGVPATAGPLTRAPRWPLAEKDSAAHRSPPQGLRFAGRRTLRTQEHTPEDDGVQFWGPPPCLHSRLWEPQAARGSMSPCSLTAKAV